MHIKKTLASLMMIALIVTTTSLPVKAWNGWDEATHSKVENCHTCGGDGKETVSCVKTTTVSCPTTNQCGNCSGNGTTPSWCSYCGVSPHCGNSTHANFPGGTCGSCGGSGRFTCSTCSGSGKKTVTCTVCKGSGSKQVVCTNKDCSNGTTTVYDLQVPTLELSKSLDATDVGYTGQDVTVTATATDDLSGVYQYQFNGGAWQADSTYTVPSTAGTVDITCLVVDNAGNESELKTIKVVTLLPQAPLVITQPTNPVYGTSFNLTATGGTTGNPITWSVEIGNVTIKAVMPGNKTYLDAIATISFSIAKKSLSTTGTLWVQDKVYDGSTKAVMSSTLTLVGVENGDDVSIDAAKASFADSNAGDFKDASISPLKLTGTNADNYSLSQPTLEGYKATIKKKSVVITPKAYTKVFGDAEPQAFEYTTSSLVGTDTVTGSLARTTGEDAGEYKYLTDNLIVSKNYKLELDPTAKFVVQKTTGTVTLEGKKVSSGGTKLQLSATSNSPAGKVAFTLDNGTVLGTATLTNNVAVLNYQPEKAMQYVVTATTSDCPNYNNAVSGTVELEVSANDLKPPKPDGDPGDLPRKDEDVVKPIIIIPKPLINEPYIKPVPRPKVDKPASEKPSSAEQPAPSLPSLVVPQTNYDLVVVDITDGVDLPSYVSLFEENHIKNKAIVGMYSAKLLLNGAEIEPNTSVEVAIPVVGKLAETKNHEVFEVADTLKQVKVLSASNEKIVFNTKTLGYFAVIGDPIISMKTWVQLVIGVCLFALSGLLLLILLYLKRKKDVDEEEQKPQINYENEN